MKKIFYLAALAVFAFASCTKEDNGKTLIEGEQASIKLSFTLPSATTRATQTADVGESKVHDINVYVFNENGTKASVGDYTSLSLSDFTKTGDVYTMEDASKIATMSGSKVIYVGINMPAGLKQSFATETLLLAKTETVTGLIKRNGAAMDGIAMFTKMEEDLIPDTEGENTINANMDRVISKVITTKGTTASNFTITWPTAGLTLAYNVLGVAVYQDAHTTFVAPNAQTLVDTKTKTTWGQVITPFASASHNYISLANTPNTETGRAPLAGFYLGENAPQTPKNGNTTYIMVKTGVTLSKTAYVDGTDIKWKNSAYGFGEMNEDVYMIRKDGKDYICDAANYNAVATALDAPYYTYEEGYVYFQVWLNASQAAKYKIYRNQYVHIEVNGIKMNENIFGGYPGIAGDPETEPIDPTDPLNPNNPDPEDPEDPIEEMPATLLVNITVKPWEYVTNATLLE